MNDNIKKFVSICIWLTTILFCVRFLISWTNVKNLWETGQKVSLCYNTISYIGEAIGMMTILMTVFNKWAWKWKWLRWVHNVPILAKYYKVTLISEYKGKKIERLGTIVLYQTFLTVNLQLKTDESSSVSLTSSFNTVQSFQYLIYTFQNVPRAEIQDQSPIHYGTAIINVSNPLILEGNYFTGRKSRGSMKFEVIEKRDYILEDVRK